MEVVARSRLRRLSWCGDYCTCQQSVCADSVVLQPPPLEMERTPLPDMLAMQERTGGQPVEVMLAAGPYTLDADLEYAPFEALVEAAIRDRPDVLLLVSARRDTQPRHSKPNYLPRLSAWTVCGFCPPVTESRGHGLDTRSTVPRAYQFPSNSSHGIESWYCRNSDSELEGFDKSACSVSPDST
jgi:hypothetical protein